MNAETSTWAGEKAGEAGATAPLDLTFVAIGYNEAESLGACIASARRAAPEGLAHEIIYVDAGSNDGSRDIAQGSGADRVLGGEKRRRAAENRNIGLRSARGKYIQFIDGDMALAPDWPSAAYEFLQGHPEVGAVCGNLNEANKSLIFRALEIDWAPREGPIRHCGGAAMYRREVLERMGGFPEDVAYGEEPLLCWRIRNELNLSIYQLNRTMADHDLGFSGLRDYWRRNVRCGATYAEIAARCFATTDPLWFKEAVVNMAWAVALVTAVACMVIGPWPLTLLIALAAALVLGRKSWQMIRRGYPATISLVYALHSYLSKLPIAYGETKWLFVRLGRALGRPS